MVKPLTILLSLLTVAAFAAETRDLVLVAGQSNAVGFNAKPTELPADAADREILFWWRCGDPPPDERDSTSAGKWEHLQAQPLGDPRPPLTPLGADAIPELTAALSLFPEAHLHVAS